MSVFFWSKVEPGRYVVETLAQTIGESEPISTKPLVIVVHHDDALAAQWAQTCCQALNAREKTLREYGIDVVYNADGTINEARSELAQRARDRNEAMANDARDYGPAE